MKKRGRTSSARPRNTEFERTIHMTKKIVSKPVCLSKKAPYYEYPQGWCIETQKYDAEVGAYIRISHRWYRTITEAKADYVNQYNLAKEKALLRGKANIKANADLPLEEFMKLFSDYRLTKVRGSTFHHLDKFIQTNFFGKYANLKIRDVFCRDFAIAFKKEVLTKDLTKQYKNKGLAYYRQMCEYAFGSGMLPPEQYAYCKFATEALVKEEEVATKPSQQRQFAMTEEEVNKLLSAIDHPVHKALTQFLFATGFRLSEALALTPREIDFGKKTITREYEWQDDEHGCLKRFHRTKNNVAGTFPASTQLLAFLYGYIGEMGIGEDDCLFPCATSKSRPIETQWYRKKLKQYCRKAGVREIHPHIARHTFCTKVSAITGDSNADKRSLEMLTGHTYAVNQGIYTHADEDNMRAIVDSIDRRA